MSSVTNAVSLLSLLCYFCFASSLDLIGIGLIAPFITAVTSPSVLDKYTLWNTYTALLGSTDERTTLTVLGSIIVSVFYLKGITSILVQKAIAKFSYFHMSHLRVRLMTVYQFLPYTYHLNKTTSSIIDSIISYTNNYTMNTLIASLRIMAEIIVMTVIIILLAVTSLEATSIMLVFTLIILFVYDKIINVRIRSSGESMAIDQQDIIKEVTHAIYGLKDVRILGTESYFGNKVKKSTLSYAHTGGNVAALVYTPRYLIESSMVTLIVGLSIYTFRAGIETANLLPVLGLFAVATLRLMPSANTIFSNIQNMKLSEYAMDSLYNDLREIEGSSYGVDEDYASRIMSPIESGQFGSGINLISVCDVNYTYPGCASPALSNVSFQIHCGQAVGIIGQSGGGKTTLVDVFLGLLEPSSGYISVDGVSTRSRLRGWQNLIAYIPQDAFVVDDTIRKNIALGVVDGAINEENVLNALKQAQLSEFVNDLPDGLDTNVGERGVRLSGGQKQRLALARAFYFERQIFVLDEATSSLDTETEAMVVSAIERLRGKKTVLVVAHRMQTVRHCDLIVKLKSGRITAIGSSEAVFKS